jgi:hypothetical protein
MTSNPLQKVLTFMCPAPQSRDPLIFGNWGCAIIILFFIFIAVLNAIGDLFS